MKAKKTLPTIPVGHPDYKWTSGADVQATWRRFGWAPPFGNKYEPISPKEPEIMQDTRKYWRVK
jgi:hypothetical protein